MYYPCQKLSATKKICALCLFSSCFPGFLHINHNSPAANTESLSSGWRIPRCCEIATFRFHETHEKDYMFIRVQFHLAIHLLAIDLIICQYFIQSNRLYLSLVFFCTQILYQPPSVTVFSLILQNLGPFLFSQDHQKTILSSSSPEHP